ncbi:hypothetical protein D9M68_648170 [compost metagenome]
MFLITQSISGFDIFKTNSSSDITSFDEVDRVLLVSVHLHDTGNTLVFTGTYVQYIRTCIQVTRVCTEEGQTTYEWIGHDLERQCSKWFFCIWFTV